MRIMAIHHDLLSLMGPTRLFLEICDLFKYLGHDVWIVGRTKRITRWKSPRGIVTEQLKTKHYHLQELGKYHPLKYVDQKDITLAELPLTYPYNYMPRALEDAIPKMDIVFSDSEIYLPLAKHVPGNYLFYIHWPPQPFRDHKPLMPEAPAKIWTNSNYTAQEIKRLWGPEWNSSWPPLDPQVIYPPLWTDMYDGSRSFDERPFDVVMFSRLYEDKFLVLPELKGLKVAIIGSDYGLKRIPKWVKVYKGVPLKTVIDVLGHSKCYVHSKGWGKMSSGAPSLPEHFGQTIVEAMACGCVPFVPNVGGPIEIVKLKSNTFSDIRELKIKVDLLLQDEGMWTKMSQRALMRARDFDVAKIAKKVATRLK